MSRIIKFRAWTGDRMIALAEAVHTNLVGVYGTYDDALLESYYGNVTLMQYTGIKDKNGVEIYEGDVVRWRTGSFRPLTIERQQAIQDGTHGEPLEEEWIWDEREVVPNKYGYLTPKGCGPFGSMYMEPENVEVVGNTYESPELIK